MESVSGPDAIKAHVPDQIVAAMEPCAQGRSAASVSTVSMAPPLVPKCTPGGKQNEQDCGEPEGASICTETTTGPSCQCTACGVPEDNYELEFGADGMTIKYPPPADITVIGIDDSTIWPTTALTSTSAPQPPDDPPTNITCPVQTSVGIPARNSNTEFYHLPMVVHLPVPRQQQLVGM